MGFVVLNGYILTRSTFERIKKFNNELCTHLFTIAWTEIIM